MTVSLQTNSGCRYPAGCLDLQCVTEESTGRVLVCWICFIHISPPLVHTAYTISLKHVFVYSRLQGFQHSNKQNMKNTAWSQALCGWEVSKGFPLLSTDTPLLQHRECVPQEPCLSCAQRQSAVVLCEWKSLPSFLSCSGKCFPFFLCLCRHQVTY